MGEQKFTGERYLPSECQDSEIRIEHIQRYRFAVEWVKDKKVLDAACGEGYGSRLLSQYAETVVGMDLDQTAVDNANEKYGTKKLSFIQGNIESLPFEDATFDVVVSFETIEHVDEKTQKMFLQEIQRVLKTDGVLIMSTPNKKIYTDLVHSVNRFHVKEFYEREYMDFLHEEFQNLAVYLQYPQLTYVLTNKEIVCTECKNIHVDECRYYIVVCSNTTITKKSYVDSVSNSDMYYFLNRHSHDLEKQLEQDTKTRNHFEKNLTDGLNDAKQYASHLESDIQALRVAVQNRDTQLAESKAYVEHLETDIRTLKKAIQERDEQILQLKS